MSEDILHQIGQILDLAAGDASLTSAEHIGLLRQSVTQLLASLGRERAERAEAAAMALGPINADVWKLIGRCDMALELILADGAAATTRRLAVRMRAEIKRATEGKATP